MVLDPDNADTKHALKVCRDASTVAESFNPLCPSKLAYVGVSG